MSAIVSFLCRWSRIAILALLIVPATRAEAQVARAPADLAAAVELRIGEILGGLADQSGDQQYRDAYEQLTSILEFAAAYAAPARDAAAVRSAAEARRLVRHLLSVPATQRPALLAYLRQSPELAATMAFLLRAGAGDDAAAAYALLDRLRGADGGKPRDLEKYAALASAVCVVHDSPLTRRVNENRAAAPDAPAIFDYFVRNEKAMVLGLRRMPAELLVHVVDTTASVEEMEWALARYRGNARVGDRYAEVKYDHAHARTGSPKKVTEAGFTLPNILKHGGVCADQAYFAAGVGKALGVPTVYVTGRSAAVGHAWVGFLEARGNAAQWNFDSGRFGEYQALRGEIVEPQTGKTVPDARLGVLAISMKAQARPRWEAAALVDAAERLGQVSAQGLAWPPAADALPNGVRPGTKVRGADAAAQLELIEAGLRKHPGLLDGWAAIARMAEDGTLSLQDKKRWAGVLDNLCGRQYPDFAFEVLKPMIASVEDPREQNALWNNAFSGFRSRPDLAAAVRLEQGRLWEKHDDPAKAWGCYTDVLEKFANDGPFAVDALLRAEALLKRNGKTAEILPLYASTWKRLKAPKGLAPEFTASSNWARVGSAYADRLQNHGRAAEADKIRAELGVAGMLGAR